MKKRFAAVFAATAVLGVTTAFAANPFSDVTPNDWAYQSVAQLAAAGVINGYPDGTFKGQNNITRYEMAQMVAKAMANEARANAEQQALINRLADEFSSELNNLGVRVATLENKVGNVKVTGDARLRFQGFEDKGNFAHWDVNDKDEDVVKGDKDKKSKFDFRGRVQFNANVNDNTSAVVRLVGSGEFHNANDSGDVTFDRVYVAHQFGEDTSAVIGRFGAVVGNGLIYDDTFDGAALAYDNGKIQALAAYGSFQTGNLFQNYDNSDLEDDFFIQDAGVDFENNTTKTNPTVTLLQVKGNLGEHATLGGFYAFGNKDIDTDIYGGSLDLQFDKVWIGGEYATFSDDTIEAFGKKIATDGENDGNDAWIAGIGFGNYNIKEQGTWGVKVQYFDLAKHSPVISSTWNNPYNSDYKAWMATVDYALAENVGLSGYWAFNGEDQDGNDLGDFYRAELNYKF
ncbi:S-layer homology domain-containing protein [Veillonella criceti]|uniref:S-layer homology domain n=1 Tax=Veillonella criceti TaxID=103891 RepID=A0A380NDL9_9FIRM|nr:S-layer homology domain-containing protein [Veillonella criceti]SUP37105.1 S-layer homology domain [Veillonella criceti]SUP45106.1 S-layer homology domain [Veillonella criceti]